MTYIINYCYNTIKLPLSYIVLALILFYSIATTINIALLYNTYSPIINDHDIALLIWPSYNQAPPLQEWLQIPAIDQIIAYNSDDIIKNYQEWIQLPVSNEDLPSFYKIYFDHNTNIDTIRHSIQLIAPDVHVFYHPSQHHQLIGLLYNDYVLLIILILVLSMILSYIALYYHFTSIYDLPIALEFGASSTFIFYKILWHHISFISLIFLIILWLLYYVASYYYIYNISWFHVILIAIYSIISQYLITILYARIISLYISLRS